MSSSEDKCEFSEDKLKDQRKFEYFREAIDSTEGRKGKSKLPLEQYIRMSRSKMQRDAIFLLRVKLSTQGIQATFRFLISSCDSTRFPQSQVARTRDLADSSCGQGSYLVVTLIRRFGIIPFLLSFRFSYLFSSILSCSDCLACGLADIWDLREIQFSYLS